MKTDIRRATVCFIQNKDQILLALIEYGPNDRKWNGIGGWAEVGESLEDAVIREVKEETFIELDKNNLKKVVEFNSGIHLNVFLTNQWKGELKTKEPSLKELKWFQKNNIPFEQMWPGTEKWLPKILASKLLKEINQQLVDVTKL